MEPLRPLLRVLLLVLGLFPELRPCRVPEANLPPPPWPKWVLGHWVWENAGTQESALQLVDDYRVRDVPVDALIVDRPWEPDVTSFTPDPESYPDMQQLVDDVHARGVRDTGRQHRSDETPRLATPPAKPLDEQDGRTAVVGLVET